MIAREQRNAMHDAGGGDDLVRRIAAEVQACRGAGNREIDWPKVKAAQDPGQLPVVIKSPLTSILCRRLPIRSALSLS